LVQKVKEHRDQKYYEIRMVVYSHTVVDPGTMMIINRNTFMTVLTMSTS